MSKSINIGLSTQELNNLQKQVDNLIKILDNASKNIVKDLSDTALENMQKIYRESNFSTSTPMDFSITGNEYEKKVAMSGEQALYCEFGTGTMGEQNSHPQKGEFGLNPYNSGRTIRMMTPELKAKKGLPIDGLYWTYKDEAGNLVYTQGIPAQKEGYDSLKLVAKKAPSVIRKRVGEAIK